jgi:hypothetical protein
MIAQIKIVAIRGTLHHEAATLDAIDVDAALLQGNS